MYLESEKAVCTCPRCSGRLVKNGYLRLKDGSRQQRYRCRSCGGSCNSYTGTLCARLKKRTQWLQMNELMTESLSLRKIAARLGIHLSTAFRWRHRWMAARCQEPQPVLAGRVSATIAVVPYSEKGSRVCHGPGSWGYWNSLRRGLRPEWMAPQDPGLPRFRRFVEGQPIRVLMLQNKSSCATYILGQGKPDEDILAYAVGSLVAEGGKIYDFSPSALQEACQQVDRLYRNGWRVFHRWQRRRQGQSQKRPNPYRLPIGMPATPGCWLAQLRGVATRYLERYLTWFTFLVAHRLQTAPSLSFS